MPPSVSEWMLEVLDRPGPIAVMIRHAERHPVRSIHHSLEVGLTKKGNDDAVKLGRMIEGRREIRLFHSPAVRCRETAEGIAEGLRSTGHRVRSIVETGMLCAPYLKDQRVLDDAERLGHEFMRWWFDGRFNGDWLCPTPEAADMVLGPVIENLRSSPPESLDIHVTHDWEIVLLREELLDLRYEDAGWVGYLDGLVLTGDGDDFVAEYEQGQQHLSFHNGRRDAERS